MILAPILILNLAASPAWAPIPEGRTTLGIQGTHFTVNGKRTFLLGISYYAGLGASEDSLRRDLDDMQQSGFNWLRVWATWDLHGQDLAVVDSSGRARKPLMGKLEHLVSECDRRGLVVDVTLHRARGASSGGVPDLAAHRNAVESIVNALKPDRNWYLDLANERDVRDDRYVPVEEIKELRELVRRLDPDRLVTASFGGHDLDERDVRVALRTAGLDFLARHRPREPGSPAQTEARTRECLAMLKALGRVAPVHDQEPLRRGYTGWEPAADDFLTDLRGALAGGAAGWCFHNGSQRGTTENRPRRSFDLRERRLFDQLDEQERIVVQSAASVVKRAPGRRDGKD